MHTMLLFKSLSRRKARVSGRTPQAISADDAGESRHVLSVSDLSMSELTSIAPG